jgi:proline iminopeptidase
MARYLPSPPNRGGSDAATIPGMGDPPTRILESGRLVTEPGVEIYWERSGAPGGIPLLYLHGGPGSGLGTGGGWRAMFDTGQHHVVAIDQRGCGRSRPLVSDVPETLTTNTTQALIGDIEALRVHLDIEHWIVSGVSWGSTLALAYALERPERIIALVLAAVTTGAREEVDWVTVGMERIFPEAWERFAEASGAVGGERIVDAYARRLASPAEADRADRHRAALDWDRWEATHVSLAAPRVRELLHEDAEARLQFATLVTHYWSQDCFLAGERAILPRVPKLSGVPITLIHGRRDISGPVITPWRLHRAIPSSQLEIVEGDGHGGTEMWTRVRAALEPRPTAGT